MMRNSRLYGLAPQLPLLLLLLGLTIISRAPLGCVGLEIDSCGLQVNRLPPLFTPEKYQLTLEPNLKTLEFNGSVDILTTYTGELGSMKVTLMSVIKQVCEDALNCGLNRCGSKLKRRILLNVGETLEIDDLKVFKLDNGGQASIALKIDRLCIDRASQVMQLILARKLTRKDQISIQIAYRGKIARESRGFYESLDRDGNDKKLATETTSTNANTHFFPAEARSTFPSFDQPDLKATFSLKLIHHKSLTAISNAKRLSEELDEASQLKRVQFAETPRMSTYVFAFAVGHYETLSCQAEGMAQPVVTAYAPLGRSREAQFTLDTVCKSIPLIEQYFKLEFPLSKLDLVVTRQMRDPARENWGMLVFTEEFLLTDEDTSNVLRAEIAKLAVHNVLHHWFGDLVTARWWDDQWIFDGFTIWRSHLVADAIYPQFDYNFNYLLRLQSPTLDAHSLEARVHPIKTYQDLTASEELALFDAATYNKAAALYQMYHSQLGEFLFRDSLALFVRGNAAQGGVADAKNFTDAIQLASGLDLSQQLASWTDQAGVPLVSVERAGQSELELKQERLAESLSVDARKQRWPISIDLTFSDGGSRTSVTRTILNDTSARIKPPIWFNSFNKTHWLKVNSKLRGLYRVSYAPNLLKHLQNPVEQQLLTAEDRFSLIDDLRALFNLAKIDTRQLEEALKWYENETSGGVLSGLAMAVQSLAAKESGGRVAEIVHRLFDQVHEEFRFKVIEGQSHATMNGRQDALLELIRYDYEDAVEEALQVFEATDVHLAPFLRKPVYLAVLRRGSQNQIDELLERLAQTRSAYEHQILVQSLAAYLDKGDEKLRERLLATIKS